MDYLSLNCKNIEVFWSPTIDGGGRDNAHEFVAIVRRLFGKVDRICEFCAGPGYIGFSLLADNLCNSLCLIDINPEAIEAIKETITRNNLQERVTVYLSDGLTDVADNEQWDLVVSNPPHFRANTEEDHRNDLISKDHDWSLHRNFFLNVRAFLKPHASIIMQECYLGSDEKYFLPYLEAGRLKFLASFMFKKRYKQWRDVYFYVWAIQNDDDFIWDTDPVELIRLDLSRLRTEHPEIRTTAWKKYRVEVFNNLNSIAGVALSNGRTPSGKEIKVFTLEHIPPNETQLTNLFYLTPGEYEITDCETGRGLCALKVESEGLS